MTGAERLLPEAARKRLRAQVLAEQGRRLLFEAVRLNREAQELDDEAADLREARRLAGTDDVVMAEERA